ncbi:MAG: aminomethyl-transferring glycine dehydrogenase subunit GcvPB, partial [Clostridia bacterium]|nr:aminomethyl-transferring glycine dehydrogenase subunit GcvPB [Clostridia bacterium]
MKDYDQLIFELSKPGRVGYQLPNCDVELVEASSVIPTEFLRSDEIDFPEVSEIDLIRHYTALSTKNYGVETGFYPLGSCTMKYNPKMNEDNAALPCSKNLHPYQPEETVQGSLEMMYDLADKLSKIAGFAKT